MRGRAVLDDGGQHLGDQGAMRAVVEGHGVRAATGSRIKDFGRAFTWVPFQTVTHQYGAHQVQQQVHRVDRLGQQHATAIARHGAAAGLGEVACITPPADAGRGTERPAQFPCAYPSRQVQRTRASAPGQAHQGQRTRVSAAGRKRCWKQMAASLPAASAAAIRASPRDGMAQRQFRWHRPLPPDAVGAQQPDPADAQPELLGWCLVL